MSMERRCRLRLRPVVGACLAVWALAFAVAASSPTYIPYLEAGHIVDVLRPASAGERRAQTPLAAEAAWRELAGRRDTEIRARLDRGNEDSLFHFLLFGTSFTRLPRAVDRGGSPAEVEAFGQLFRGRLRDLIDGIASPGKNERLLFAGELVRRQGINPATSEGRERVRRYLVEIAERASAEAAGYARTLQSAASSSTADAVHAARATLFRDRGLSSDTSMLSGFAIEEALRAIRDKRLLGGGSVRRVAVVGPGLDFVDKADGYDFYPPQSIQPFALADSLLRLGLADRERLRVTTFDINPRINAHLEEARRRAGTGAGYVVTLPWDAGRRWTPGLRRYWERFGDRIGEPLQGSPVPAGRGIEARTVRIRPPVVRWIEPMDLNIAWQRLHPLEPVERFDLVVATNVFVYYDDFEQQLALANVAAMLRPGGLFLSNDAPFPLPGTPMISSVSSSTIAYTDPRQDEEYLIAHQRE
jgi:SAM-dependent methyltransferase